MGTDVPIFALPPDPVYGGRVPVGFCNISGAQNLSGFYRFIPGHFVVADFVSLASPYRTKLAHSIAPPLQRKPALLGFALGAAFGGLFGWKIIVSAVLQLRLNLPSRRRLVLSRRARPPGRAAYICGPASVRPLRKEGSGFCVRRRGGSVTRPSGFRQVGGRGDPCGRLLFPCRTT